jgi:hypothetical protein
MVLLILYEFIFPLSETSNPAVACGIGGSRGFNSGNAGCVVIKTGDVTPYQYDNTLGQAHSEPDSRGFTGPTR